MSMEGDFISEFINNYQVEHQMGAGAFGTVYKCRQVKFLSVREEERTVAVKLIEFKAREEENVTHEIDLLRKLDHPHIIRIFKSWVEYPPPNFLYLYKALEENSKGVIFIETEFCNLKTLRHWFIQSWRKKEHAQIFLYQIASGVQYLHEKCIIHRDLKPENILLREEQSTRSVIAKICDFGISRTIKETMTSKIGTLGYLSPEVLRGRHYNMKADVYALGIIFYEMLVLGDFTNVELSVAFAEMRLNNLTNYTFQFLSGNKSLINSNEKSFIQMMVDIDPGKRPDAKNVLLKLCEIHPNITSFHISANPKILTNNEIQQNLNYLCNHITNLHIILNDLIQLKIISDVERQQINSKSNNFEKNKNLLNVLQVKDWSKNKSIFLKVLIDTGNEQCADLVDKIQTKSNQSIESVQFNSTKKLEDNTLTHTKDDQNLYKPEVVTQNLLLEIGSMNLVTTTQKDPENVTNTSSIELRKEKLINFLTGISDSTTISGLHLSKPKNAAFDKIQRIAGVLPGILTTEMPEYSAGVDEWKSFVEQTISDWNNRYLVHIRYSPYGHPLNDILKNQNEKSWNDSNEEKGERNKLWKTSLDKLAPFLLQLQTAGDEERETLLKAGNFYFPMLKLFRMHFYQKATIFNIGK